MEKYEVGTRFKIKKGSSNEHPVGSIGTILEKAWTPWVRMDDDYLNTDYVAPFGKCSIVNNDEIELI